MEVYVSEKIVCEYKTECRTYDPWINDNRISPCLSCRNNKYKKTLKKNYYKPPIGEMIFGIFAVFMVIGLFVLMFK